MEGKYKFIAVQEVEEHELYKHILEDKTLYITDENDKAIATLGQTDIVAMLRALGLRKEIFKGLF